VTLEYPLLAGYPGPGGRTLNLASGWVGLVIPYHTMPSLLARQLPVFFQVTLPRTDRI
jgi:hypothetical protein